MFNHKERKGHSADNLVSVSSTYFVQGIIQGHSAQLVVDTGVTFSLISHNFWTRINSKGVSPKPWEGPKLVGFNGDSLTVEGQLTLPINLGGCVVEHQMIITSPMTTDFILGADFC